MTRASLAVLVLALAAFAQRPSDAEAKALIERVRQKALAYAKSLPDFECTETVRRYGDFGARRMLGLALKDKLSIRVRYSQHKEEHKLILIDDKPTDVAFESLQGSIGTGEFGATLSAIFEPVTATAFHWQSWKTEHKHRIAVYSYLVDAAHSRYRLSNGVGSDIHAAMVAYHGALEIESETGEVLQFSYAADHLPKELNMVSASTTVDYDFADVGGRPYLLPASAETKLEAPAASTRNVIEFRDYHKFNAESSIDFGTVK
jgi:hypothetical protein